MRSALLTNSSIQFLLVALLVFDAGADLGGGGALGITGRSFPPPSRIRPPADPKESIF